MSPTASSLKKAFGRRLRTGREAAGYSTAHALAEAMGIQENTLSKWERGGSYPRHPELLRIRNTTGLTADFLYFGDLTGLPVRLAAQLRRLHPDIASDEESDVA